MTSEQSADSVRISRIIDAPRDQVFQAWTEPDQIRRWWGPGEFTCPEAVVDLRPGGSYRLAMQPTEGEPFVVGGTYREVAEFPASHGPAPYQMGWEGGLEKFGALFAGSGVDA